MTDLLEAVCSIFGCRYKVKESTALGTTHQCVRCGKTYINIDETVPFPFSNCSVPADIDESWYH